MILRATLRLMIVAMALLTSKVASADPSLSSAIDRVQPKMVKIYGAGGIRGLEAYQSGFLISSEGHILTVWSYVLDTDNVVAVLNDGRRFDAAVVGIDPRLEIAVLKIAVEDVDSFDRSSAVPLTVGDFVLAFSNLYGVAAGSEPCSVLHGVVSAVTTLSARRGAYKTLYDGPVYIVDAMTNNAGAAGGVLTDHQGRLAGLLGKELRNVENNVWLNYVVPISELNEAIDDILAGKVRPRNTEDRKRPQEPVELDDLGIVLLPNILSRTPPFIQFVEPGSPAAKAGLQADDLVLYVGSTVVHSREELLEELSYIDRLDEVRLTVQRGQKLISVELIAERTK